MTELLYTKCPVCLDTEGSLCERHQGSSPWYDCSICGFYEMDYNLDFQIQGGHYNYGNWRLNSVHRAILSHHICKYNIENCKKLASNEAKMFRITVQMLDSIRSEATLPSRVEQAENLIRYVGDNVFRLGNDVVEVSVYKVHAIIGSLNHMSVSVLIKELEEKGIIKSNSTSQRHNIYLTIDGWERYEEEKKGQFSGNYGFLAMKFGEKDLDSFVKEVLKPVVKEKIGFNLVDMRDVPEPGIIDNIMRITIRDSKFVIADLTHDNNGAYWEAGFAEGLGKPVIFICKKDKFKKDKTHFDTNHCTTVLWCRDNDEEFKKELIATIRSSPKI